MKKFDMSSYIKFSCWTSIVLILWGWVTEIVKINVSTIFVFVFFCVIALSVWAQEK